MITYNLLFEKKASKGAFVNILLDKEFKEIWTNKTFFPANKNGYLAVYNSGFLVDNKGRVMYLLEVQNDKESIKKTGVDNYYDLLIYENGVTEPRRIKININKKTIFALNLVETSNPNEIITAGTYSEKANGGWFSKPETKGTFLLKINTETGVIGATSVNPFTKKILDFMRVEPRDQAQGGGVKNVQLHNVLITDKNEIVMSMEEGWVEHMEATTSTSRSEPFRGMSGAPNLTVVSTKNERARDFRYSRTMFTVKYDADGKIIYQNYIPKSLSGKNGSIYGLYHFVSTKGEIQAVVFNDHSKNAENTIKDFVYMKLGMPGYFPTVARLAQIDKDGKRKVSTLFNSKEEEDYILQPALSLQYADGVLITASIVDDKKFKLIKIEY
jgi:hypothetical protein